MKEKINNFKNELKQQAEKETSMYYNAKKMKEEAETVSARSLWNEIESDHLVKANLLNDIITKLDKIIE